MTWAQAIVFFVNVNETSTKKFFFIAERKFRFLTFRGCFLYVEGSVVNGKRLFLATITSAAFVTGGRVFAANNSKFPSAALYGYGGYSVYKSEMVQSNDTALTFGYGVEVFTGRDHQFGIGVHRESSKMAFSLNRSMVSIDTDIFRLSYAFGPFFIGPLFNYSFWDVEAPPDLDANDFLDQNTDSEPYVKASGQGLGLHGGVNFALGKKMKLYLKVAGTSTIGALQETPSETSQAGVSGTSPSASRKFSIGTRTDGDIGALFLLTRETLQFLFGFKTTSYQLELESRSFKETQNTTYVGLQGSWYL